MAQPTRPCDRPADQQTCGECEGVCEAPIDAERLGRFVDALAEAQVALAALMDAAIELCPDGAVAVGQAQSEGERRPDIRPLMPLTDVTELVGRGEVTIWRRRKAGKFPQPVLGSPGKLMWDPRDIDRWLDDQRRAKADEGVKDERAAAVTRTVNQTATPKP